MSDTNAPEPTMEEILASIRRIISEDEPAPEPSTAEQSASPPHGDKHGDDILELTERVDDESEAPPAREPTPMASDFETSGDLDIYTRSEAPATSSSSFDDFEDEEVLVGPPAAQSASSAFGQLARTVSMPAEGRVLEDVVRELLRPMLKEWLDRNLPEIVEQAVQAEVERIARRRGA